MSSLADLLLAHPFTDDEALLHTADRTLTAGEARARTAELADRLRAAGVRPGTAAAVRLPNSPESVLAMTAIWSVGAVFVPVNAAAPPAEVEYALAAAHPVALVETDPDDGVRVRRLDPAPDTAGGVEVAGGAGGAGGAAVPSGVAGGGVRRVYDVGTAFVTWTSGTTGTPKAILHTHDGYLELLDRVLRPLRARATATPARPPSPNLIPVSLALNSGIYNALFGLRAGAALVIMDRFRPREFADLVARFGIRSTVLPPAAIAMLTASDVEALAPLRYVRSITAALSPLQARRFTERFGAFVLNSYGQAEIGEVIGWTAADAKAHPEKVGAAGRPLPGVEIRVGSETGAPDGEVGPLWVRPPRMASGYATGELLADRIDAEGFLDTGDLARMDEDGFVWIEGRAGDLINRGGNKVFPEQVEEVLQLHPAVFEAAVAGAPDERLGEVPVAFVVDAHGAVPATDDELVRLCRDHLVAYKVPVAFHRVDALPRTEVGKLRRQELLR
ncbi:class I adenylate-forming enzyme family protein [Cryptosporangium aurantiacum]|uniref:Acyl-CoA synthetase (AMP-forming)/AMP-acid ligase II n=1 Tax=Cryptosporangium aurantiacum TaxID=134849 RepID=A0A1M7RK94_9ACTN|nr:class I adenylate-forming enzyme family protein [Cryptosporangium aurantiacum]SHN46560.1 Acyl-CoA synthetase (AMP-forming)/AMP-acid ligase II [Cryptosporangium aurantiacum]